MFLAHLFIDLPYTNNGLWSAFFMFSNHKKQRICLFYGLSIDSQFSSSLYPIVEIIEFALKLFKKKTHILTVEFNPWRFFWDLRKNEAHSSFFHFIKIERAIGFYIHRTAYGFNVETIQIISIMHDWMTQRGECTKCVYNTLENFMRNGFTFELLIEAIVRPTSSAKCTSMFFRYRKGFCICISSNRISSHFGLLRICIGNESFTKLNHRRKLFNFRNFACFPRICMIPASSSTSSC